MSGKTFVKEENGIKYFNNGDWIDLSNLPRNKRGVISWKSSSNCDVPIKCSEYIGIAHIIKYNTRSKKVLFKLSSIDDRYLSMDVEEFSNCKIGKHVKFVNGFKKSTEPVAISHPHLLHYFLDKNDAYSLTHGSNKIVPMICPECNYKKIPR